MKKAVVFTLTGLSILFLLGLGLLADNARALFGMSADALAGDTTVMARPKPSRMKRDEAPPAMPEEIAEAFGSEDSKAMRGLGMHGAGPGGGGKGDGIGIGGIGTMGRGGGNAPAPVLMQKRMNTIQVIRGSAATGAADKDEGGAAAEAPATRAWFPETFLFEPVVVTDAEGHANVPVKVPDRLTTWRVLALAHSREGGQAGATASFLGTLPTYVEPVVPAFLVAGDEVRLPVQVVNTTEEDVRSPLKLLALNATLSSTGGEVKVPAGGSAVQYVTMKAPHAGPVSLKATLGSTDAVERVIDVKPAGRPVVASHGGTLAAPRTFELEGPANPLEGTESIRVQVYPGALGLVRSELSAATNRGGVADTAYLLQLVGHAPALLKSLGGEAADGAIRDLTLLATQRAMQFARAPSVDAATLLAEGALAHPGNPVLERLGERLANQVAMAQRPDGTCQGADGWTLQRLLVTTAECVRAVKASDGTPQARQRATAVALKASGAFERNAARVTDGYTAAAILASGAVSGTVADQLKDVLLKSLETSEDGSKFVRIDQGVVRADGTVPSSAEATALAVLALLGDAKAPVADLGTFVLGNYKAWGWGDGRANMVALKATVALFKDPVPPKVALTFARDGKVMTEGEFGADKLKEVVTLEGDAAGSAGKHSWTVKAEPAVPGLGFSVTLTAWVPWKPSASEGLSLQTTMPKKLKVGEAAVVALAAAMPANLTTELKFALPAGVQPDAAYLDREIGANRLVRYETEDGLVTLHLPAMPAGKTWEGSLRVIPTLGGHLQSGASRLAPEGRPEKATAIAPMTWVID